MSKSNAGGCGSHMQISMQIADLLGLPQCDAFAIPDLRAAEKDWDDAERKRFEMLQAAAAARRRQPLRFFPSIKADSPVLNLRRINA
jgi:hypothetical protein